MKKVLAVAALLFTASLLKAQDILVCKNVHLSFYSSAPIEDIEAVTEKGVSALNITSKEIFFKVEIQSFQFKKGLMQEHFNEDYMESDKYPFAEFRGKLLSAPDLTKDGTYPVTVSGTLNIHNVSKEYQVPGSLTVRGGRITATADFKVRLADHHIKIPRLLVRNIAEVVDVKVSAAYTADKTAK